MRKIYFLIISLLFSTIPAFAGEEGGHGVVDLPLLSVLPFVLILIGIAILPLVAEHWWEQNKNKLIVSAVLGIPILVYLFLMGLSHEISHVLIYEYIPFIVLLWALFYISGGIVLRGDIEATPINNSIFLLIGSILASLIGTTGASMLLIRPLLKTNSERKHVVHTVIFFIFMVSNIGGSLTPIGDPPLFLGYLKGVPFAWTFRFIPEWAFAIGILLVLYFIIDTWYHGKETKKTILEDKTHIEPLSMVGAVNFIWLFGVIIAVAFINSNYFPIFNDKPYLGFVREIVMGLMVVASLYSTKKEYREENEFTMHPIQEVAYLFIGIFITMIPALYLLKHHGGELGVNQPWQFFWATGGFSSFLDNAPTYVTFFSLIEGLLLSTGIQESQLLHTMLTSHSHFLEAVSIGAVFMGANTYIGNAPNFMVKSIAEHSKIKMPSFVGYMMYSALILIPLFLLVTFVFFV